MRRGGRGRLGSGLLPATCAAVVLLGVGCSSEQSGADPIGSTPEVVVDRSASPPAADVGAIDRRRPAVTPVRLDIPAIAVSTTLVRLGLEEDHTVEVPQRAGRAGWFEPGSAPGAVGSAVILGHVDSATGPGVFARLDELVPGDLVDVRRADGTVVVFEVLRLTLFDNARFPARRVYAAPSGRRLNLVTCGGEYDADRGGYQSNLVVFTRLVRELPPLEDES